MLDPNSYTGLIEQICQSLSTPVAVKDLNHRYICANEAFAEGIGVPLCELIGKNDLDIGRPEELVLGSPEKDWPGLWAIDDQIIGSESSSPDARVVQANAYTDPSVRLNRTPLTDAHGRVFALMVQKEDISDVLELKRLVASNLENLSEKTAELNTMDSVLASFLTCRDTHSLVNELAKVILHYTHATSTRIWLLDETRDFMECAAAVGAQSAAMVGQRRDRNEGRVGRAWQSRKTVVFNDKTDDCAYDKAECAAQFCAVPVIVEADVIAIIAVAREDALVSGASDWSSTSSRPLSSTLSGSVPLLERIASVASIAMVNARMSEETERALERSRTLVEISEMLMTVEDSFEAYDTICRMMLSAYLVSRASCYLFDEDRVLQPHVAWGFENGKPVRVQALTATLAAGSLLQWVADNGQTAVVQRADERPIETEEMHVFRQKANIGSSCCLPLMKKNVVVGVMSIARARNLTDFSLVEIDGFQAIVNQMSTAIERLELSEDLQRQAFHDRLTHLPNRHHFERALKRAIRQADAAQSEVQVLFIDLDGFKLVNDTLGHAAGDQLLTIVASRFSNVMRSGDILARMGGDEFAAILTSNESDTREGHDVAERLIACLRVPIDLGGETTSIGASIGLSRFPEHGCSVDELLGNADMAMYQAKNAGKGSVCHFNQELSKTLNDSVHLKNDLRKAVDDEEFCLMYQPQIRCNDNQVVGLEALIRWDHPVRGLVQPNDFIPVAEETGLIYRIGNWVINEAVRQLARWQATPLRGLRLCINVEASLFKAGSFADDVLAALDRYGAPAKLLELEVTESVVVHNVDLVSGHLFKLRESGVRISIDDFGTGYSSLSYLRDLPLDALKIDRTFVTRLCDDAYDQSILNTILTLASSLGLETVAEGVELPEQKDAVVQMGCDLVQGYLYSRPVPPEELVMVIQGIESQCLPSESWRRSA